MKFSFKKLFLWCILAVLLIFVFTPIYWLVKMSLQYEKDVLKVPPDWIPNPATLNQYLAIPTRTDALKALLNTIIIATFTALISVSFAFLAAYAFSRFIFRGKSHLLMVILATQMLPAMSTLIPIFLTLRALHLLDTYFGITAVYAATQLPILVWMLIGFVETVPKELEESAMLDGCSRLQMMARIVFPICVPGIVAALIFSVVSSFWDLIYALVLTSVNAKPLGVWLGLLLGRGYREQTRLAAYGVFVTIPLVILIYASQRYMVKGLAAGAVKG